MIYPVKYFHSGMRGAPTMRGAAGAFLGMLDACLGSGFGLVSVSAISVSGGVATASVNVGDTFEVGAVVLVDGATPNELNGEARVLTSTTTSFTFSTDAPDGSASGTISARYAPAHNWSKLHSGTDTAVWASVDPEANGHCLRIDDTGTTFARVVGYESMSDVDTGVNPFPTQAQVAGGGYWAKSTSASAQARPWVLVADGRFFLFCIAHGATAEGSNRPFGAYGFGDLIATAAAGDAWNTSVFVATASLNYGHSTGALWRGIVSNSDEGCWSVRDFGGTVASVLHRHSNEVSSVGGASGNDSSLGSAPSLIDGKVRVLKMRTFVGTGPQASMTRALVPGMLYLPHTGVTSLFETGQKIDVDVDGITRQAMFLPSSTINEAFNGSELGFALDITGPWR